MQNLQNASAHIQHFKQVAVNQADTEKSFFNVKTYLSEILTFLRLKNSHHTLTFDCPDNLDIESYPGMFLQIITHLVTNSFQHGFEEKERGTISINIFSKDGQLCIYYEDNGKGIPPKVIEKIFDPFFLRQNVGLAGLDWACILSTHW